MQSVKNDKRFLFYAYYIVSVEKKKFFNFLVC